MDRPPLVVDLDGTLSHGDLLHEAMARLGLRAPLTLLRLAWQHRRSLPEFKVAVAKLVPIDPATLPYEPRVLDHLKAESERGTRIILATASPRIWAEPIAQHLGFFSDVIATDETGNLKSQRKLAAIRELLGETPFAYIGDSAADIPLFAAATGGRLLAGSSSRPLAYLRQSDPGFTHLAPTSRWHRIKAAIRGCRPQHWAKNVLIFLPAITSWGIYDPAKLFPACLAFIAVCFMASAVYLVNDLADLAADRAHKEKRRRPLAAGTLPVLQGFILALCLALASLSIAAATSPLVLGALVIYVVLNAAYTARLKEIPLADIALLCCFYLLRVILGLLILEVPPSVWFLAFLGCLFAELAHWKRYVEVLNTPASSSKRRSYTASDAVVLLAFGVGFSFTAALVLTLYLRSDEISPVYRSPTLLAILAPILLLHNLGMWLEASRGHAKSDPVMSVLLSRKSWLAAAASFAVLVMARLLPLP